MLNILFGYSLNNSTDKRFSMAKAARTDISDDEFRQNLKRRVGRPKMDDHTKLIRRVYRSFIKMKELIFLINLGEQLLETTGGTSGTYVKSYTLTKRMYQKVNRDLRDFESNNGLEHVELEDIMKAGDPIVDDELQVKVGRKRKTKLDALDYQVRYIDKQIARVVNEEDKANVSRGDGRGRPKVSKTVRISKYKIRQEALLAQIDVLEMELDMVSVAIRGVKKARDAIRITKQNIKVEVDVDERLELINQLDLDQALLVREQTLVKTIKKRALLQEQLEIIISNLNGINDNSLESKIMRKALTVEQENIEAKLEIFSL